MKTIDILYRGNKVKSFFEGVWQILVLATLAFVLLCFTNDVQAARISFSPNGLTVDVAPGETVAVPVNISLEDPSSPYYYVNFGLSYEGGSLANDWISGGGNISLNLWNNTQRAVFYVSPPAYVANGSYIANIGIVSLRSSEIVTNTGFTIAVNVAGQSTCSQTPTFSEIASSKDVIAARNNKPIAIELSGTVSSPDGCDVESLQYVLQDEYGELDQTENVYVRVDGSFAADVEMIASRKGNDKDGRHYKIKFVAENEAGSGESDDIVFVVEHDQRNK